MVTLCRTAGFAAGFGAYGWTGAPVLATERNGRAEHRGRPHILRKAAVPTLGCRPVRAGCRVNPVLLFAVVWGVVLVSLTAMRWRRLRRSGYRPWRIAPPLTGGGHVFAAESSAAFRGGATHLPASVSWPGGRLEVDAAWAHVSAAGLIDVWIPRERVTAVTPVRTSVATTLRFVAPGGDFDGVLFLALKPGPVLAAFQAYGWPVTGS